MIAILSIISSGTTTLMEHFGTKKKFHPFTGPYFIAEEDVAREEYEFYTPTRPILEIAKTWKASNRNLLVLRDTFLSFRRLLPYTTLVDIEGLPPGNFSGASLRVDLSESERDLFRGLCW